MEISDRKNVPGTEHLCKAEGCATILPSRLIFCASHWNKLPEQLREVVWDRFHPGWRLEDGQKKEFYSALREAVYYLKQLDEDNRPKETGKTNAI